MAKVCVRIYCFLGALLLVVGELAASKLDDRGYQTSPAFKAWCLQSRNCMPEANCSNISPAGDWKICQDDLPADPSQCLVYSVGIANDWSFDAALGKLGCEVHAFDPTVEHPEDLAPNVTFHMWGLRAGDISQEEMLNKYGKDGGFKGPLYTLPEVMSKLGHTGRHIHVLKIDCEGCEWNAFQSLANLKQAGMIPDQVLFEVHLSEQYGIRGPGQLDRLQVVFDYLFEPDQEGRSFARHYYHNNVGFAGMRTISETMLGAGIPNTSCCREMGFTKRMPGGMHATGPGTGHKHHFPPRSQHLFDTARSRLS